ncbi:lipopolysaccharide 1,3-galactosyltransferase [Jejubacter calystegiae]|uniref:Lipopolysaccharide 1,3-galactosyltransferase n=1 Tax=Jejubacter calystegiae TaxID=2579935 RepID=A0A4P8YF43_9ENTR|nr:glycosyltransferase [Jejubacter calystegiae]QCT19255.1 lipopolysaccharide 1,3-galactosyltransferase [Jejubacter calystegiae]
MYFHESEVIRDKIILGNEIDHGSETQHIAYGTDAGFLIGCAVSVASVLQNNKDKTFCFHLFTDKCDSQNISKFQQLSKEFSSCIIVYIISTERLIGLPSNKLWSTAIYYRFIIADILREKCQRVLYLDSDIICQGDISELFLVSLADNIIAASIDRNKEWWQNRAHALNMPELENGYFNSGVLVINTNGWASFNLSEKAISLLSDDNVVPRLGYYDQDVLNILTCGNVLFINPIFNTQYSLNYELKDHPDCPIEDTTKLIHYVGPTKPWHIWAKDYLAARPFVQAKEASPWCDTPYQKPSTAMQYRYAAKHSLKAGEYIAGACFYYSYIFCKIFK